MQSSIQVRSCVAWVGGCLLVLLGCTRAAPEQRLRATLEQMHQAIEAREIDDAMAPVAEDFVGENGLDAAGLRRWMRVQMLGSQQIGVTMGPVDLALRGDTATVRFTALLTGSNGRWVPDQAPTCQVTTGWRLQGSGWQLYHAQWALAGR
ncbi:nuclear transport factor 2 family protein [Xanthomonas prunicola]|uniref:nuclear transport factor 2 family protein n=1 Tax=Xanthomonas prunicola TaxID=2053930 RepID=UPI0021B2014B|nr:nuclear transport factor 2 family protein [Xanthomonas prunicola]UXA53054.1 nuclear transport factor 2 family protein [Xanthomonas prunicola]